MCVQNENEMATDHNFRSKLIGFLPSFPVPVVENLGVLEFHGFRIILPSCGILYPDLIWNREMETSIWQGKNLMSIVLSYKARRTQHPPLHKASMRTWLLNLWTLFILCAATALRISTQFSSRANFSTRGAWALQNTPYLSKWSISSCSRKNLVFYWKEW